MFIIYKRTSPSGHSYIGYTKLPLMRRWKISIQECRTSRKGSPLANAILKYGSENWSHEILFETDDELLAKDAEAVYISLLGYYNVAKGGDGGNTGKNGDPDKRRRQAKALKAHWNNLSEDEKKRRVAANLAARTKNGTLGNKTNHKSGEEHGNHNGNWVCANVEYTTLKDAAKGTGKNQSTILKLCVTNVDKVVPKAVSKRSIVPSGKTPRECGWYKKDKK